MSALLTVALLTVLTVTSSVSPAAAVTDCSVPINVTIRGISSDLDQCYDLDFTHGGTDYAIHVYYRETPSAANTQVCVDSGDVASRCEHELTDNDDTNGNNVDVVSMAAEARDAVKFYIDQDFNWPPAGVTDINVWVAEDPRTGGISGSTTIYVDDDTIDGGDPLWHRLLAYHEFMHSVQTVNDGSIGWDSTYGEGISRAIEDRVDEELDALMAGYFFIGEAQGLLSNNSDRIADLLTESYRTSLWWTWLMDQYRTAGEVDPRTGWDALEDFYAELAVAPDEATAIYEFIAGQSSSFEADWIDYTLALYAHEFDPSDGRLDFLDQELIDNSGGLSGHTVLTGGPAFSTSSVAVNPRSAQYWEFDPANQCDFVAYTFDGNGQDFGFSVMTVNGGTLDDRWSSQTDVYARTVSTAGLDSVAGVISGLKQGGTVDLGIGCVQPTVNIKSPTSGLAAMVGNANNPENFLVRVEVDGAGGSGPIGGLTADAFDVTVTPSSGGAAIAANVISSAYVQDDYWLAVEAPSASDGAVTGSFYNLTVDLGSATDTNNQSVLYVDQEEDVVVVLDRSGSMGNGTGKLEAAQNAAELFFTDLSSNDQGGYVAFDSSADPRVDLDLLDAGQRSDLETAVTTETAGGQTSIGDGMLVAADMHDALGDPDHVCSFVLLSDGHENQSPLWDDVKNDVRDNGCPIHVIALGPEAQEPLLQDIGSQPAGSTYDYADAAGSVPIGGNSGAGAGGSGGGAGGASPGGTISWENNLSRVYDYKAIQVQGRQRVLGEGGYGNSECTGWNRTVDFEDQPNESFKVGESFISNGQRVDVEVITFASGQTGSGAFRTGEFGVDIGNGQIGSPTNTTGWLRDLEACRISVETANFGGIVNVVVNGDLALVENLADLDGQTVGDAEIRFDKETGVLVATGYIKEFAIGGQEFFIDNLRIQNEGEFHEFVVDKTSDLLAVSVAWQSDLGGSQTIKLIDPSGNGVTPSVVRQSPRGTNEVAEVKQPEPGVWRVAVDNIGEEYYISASVETQLELFLFVGTPVQGIAGTEVPIMGMLVGPDGPVKGADLVAMITPPGEAPQTLRLFDDENHDDGEADDGVYANLFTATTAGDVAAQREEIKDGQEPTTVGSYMVDLIATIDEHRREAQGSFALSAARDSDGDGAPDRWEQLNGLDPENIQDGEGDDDFDALSNACEFWHGTDPNNSDTDGGGEADGSEVRRVSNPDERPAQPPASNIPAACGTKIRDPHNPADDAGGPTVAIFARPEGHDHGPTIVVQWSHPQSGDYVSGELWRRKLGGGGWEYIAKVDGLTYEDGNVADGAKYQYMIRPFASTRDGLILTNVLRTGPVLAQLDPEAPDGHVLINGNEPTTASSDVVLTIEATDEGGGHHHEPGGVGTPRDDLEMRISNQPQFSGPWQPFKEKVAWNLGPLSEGDVGQVFIQFRDEAGNVSVSGLGWTDSIVFQSVVVPLCDGQLVTIDMNVNGGNGFGTGGPDVILGTPGNDVINGLSGNDTICAGEGNDFIAAGAGNDRVFGEDGIDTIFGATGNDYLSGGGDDDVIIGQGGFDTIFGLDGDDNVWGMGANDIIYGGHGADKLRGNGGVDTIRGGPGLDQIWGNNLGDRLFGEGTRDIIRGGGGPDLIVGGEGNDDLYGDANADILTGGAGFDRFDGGAGPDSCTDVAGGEPAVSC